MSHRPAAVIVAAIAAALAVLPAAAAPAQPRETLRAEVGPGFTIFLRHADGTAVTQLDAGEYAIVVEDKAIEHNFHLSGAGVDQFTSVENAETATWTVVFADVQIYRYQCDPHSTTMMKTFKVGNVPDPAATSRRAPPERQRQRQRDLGEDLQRLEGARGRRRQLPHLRSGHREDAELPSHGAGHQPEDGGCRHSPGDVERAPTGREVQLPLGQEAAPARFLHRQVVRLAGLIRPAFGPPAARMSA